VVTKPELVGITATLPVEVMFAAGLVPVDLNNIFISDENPRKLVQDAQNAGLPENVCAWIKGIYSAVHKYGIKKVIGVTGGDCTNTRALLELFQSEGIETFEFSYPYPRDVRRLKAEIERFSRALETTPGEAGKWKGILDPIRAKVHQLDRLTWKEDKVTGWENHYYSVSTSDFFGDPRRFEKEIDEVLAQVRLREPLGESLRIAFLGVPPILTNLHDFLEERGARIVLNEFARQFSMPYASHTIVQQYNLYTYPYDTASRMRDCVAEVARRRVDGVINYVQNFCYRQIVDRLVRNSFSVPVLTLYADKPGEVDGQTATRLEAFLEILRGRRER
jgi:benzoyl-CoA reductase/2-hydroxyglutaryl-CoA dehydratase subunit BcrC/BadD/HgdB